MQVDTVVQTRGVVEYALTDGSSSHLLTLPPYPTLRAYLSRFASESWSVFGYQLNSDHLSPVLLPRRNAYMVILLVLYSKRLKWPSTFQPPAFGPRGFTRVQ